MSSILSAFAFLTRLPVRTEAISDRDLGRSVGFFPLVGLVLGLATAGEAYGCARFLPPTMTAVIVVSTLAVLTGGLHLDGMADLADGLAGGRGDRERTLAIMRDSRIGAQGAVAVFLLLAGKIAATAALVESRDFLALVAIPVVGRFAVGPSIVLFPYARSEGLGRAFKGQAGLPQLAIGFVTMAVVALVLGPPVPRAALGGLAVALLLGLGLRARLGGLTGDMYGATIELAEVTAAFLAAVG